MAFSFGTPKTVTGFTLPTTTTAASGFQFSGAGGDAKVVKQALNFSFTPSTTATVSSTTSTTSAPSGFSFTSGTTTTPQFNLGSTSNTTTTPQFNLNSTSAPSTLQFGLGTSSTTASPQFNLGSSGTTTTTPQFSLTSATTATSGLSFPLPTTTTTASTLLNVSTASSTTGASTSTTAPSIFSLPTNTTSKQATSTTTAASIASTAAPTSTTAITTPSLTGVAPTTSTLSYSQLEDLINKWTIYLEDEGKHLINQARQLNAWDRLLVMNGEKIICMNSNAARVKETQDQLNQELDFVLAQLKELGDLIEPLEKEVLDLPVTDVDRLRAYQLAETMDTQLKQMSEDLKEIIEHLNESNKIQESANPIIQIGRILNVHMNSLQWIDRNTTKIITLLDQVAKMQEMNKRNHEINLHRTYE